jgi:hypothetical protein
METRLPLEQKTILDGSDSRFWSSSMSTRDLSPDGKMMAVTARSPGPSAGYVRWVAHRFPRLKLDQPVEGVRRWDTETGQELADFRECSGPLFAPDGRTFGTFGVDKTLKLWELPPRKPVLLLVGMWVSLGLLTASAVWWCRARLRWIWTAGR